MAPPLPVIAVVGAECTGKTTLVTQLLTKHAHPVVFTGASTQSYATALPLATVVSSFISPLPFVKACTATPTAVVLDDEQINLSQSDMANLIAACRDINAVIIITMQEARKYPRNVRQLFTEVYAFVTNACLKAIYSTFFQHVPYIEFVSEPAVHCAMTALHTHMPVMTPKTRKIAIVDM